ncbi:hypothetical protein GPJ56_009161 [Histomonas meleagridis]|uniref:uncharacterized protein n=1 Tax=Histomonas meleagridis TaxID=135588 RepID=UPI00355AB3A1|nr:hypothetical protein GPJ56_009161 [Histomonas meleagridis]KAH0799085.1 hypothetical protein GO595_007882 [Histomonas meleagridis]
MNQGEIFWDFKPETFISHRYSPLCALYVEDKLNEIIKDSKVTFNDIFLALGLKAKPPVRILDVETMDLARYINMEKEVLDETIAYSQSFVTPEFEESGKIIPQKSPVQKWLPETLKYPSSDAANPPWYTSMTRKLFSSQFYLNMDFCDFPQCIAYVSDGGSSSKSADDVRKLIKFPEWMVEFKSTIPILHIVIQDKSSENSKPPKGSFDELFCVTIEFNKSTPTTPTHNTLTNFFSHHPNFDDPDFCKNLNDSDLVKLNDSLPIIRSLQKMHIDPFLQQCESTITNSKQLKNRLKGWIQKGKKPDKTTVYMGIPMRKITRLQLASLYMITGRYKEARSMYKEFYMSLKNGIFPDLRLFGEFMAALSASAQPNMQKKFHDGINSVFNDMNITTQNIRFVTMIPLLIAEIYQVTHNRSEAIKLLIKATDNIMVFSSFNPQIRTALIALIYERISGLEKSKKKSLFYTAKACLNV